MMTISGKVLGVTTEERQGQNGSFTSTNIHLLDGLQTQRVQVGRDFPVTDMPREGEDVTLSISVSAFSRRDGSAGVQITTQGLLADSAPGLRVASNS